MSPARARQLSSSLSFSAIWRFGTLNGKGFLAAGLGVSIIISFVLDHFQRFSLPIFRDNSGSRTKGHKFSLSFHLSAADLVEKSDLDLISEAPVIGHGTVTIPDPCLLESRALSTISLTATANPHNQFFVVAIQLGALGTCLLVAMWIVHLMYSTIPGLFGWFGRLVVAART